MEISGENQGEQARHTRTYHRCTRDDGIKRSWEARINSLKKGGQWLSFEVSRRLKAATSYQYQGNEGHPSKLAYPTWPLIWSPKNEEDWCVDDATGVRFRTRRCDRTELLHREKNNSTSNKKHSCRQGTYRYSSQEGVTREAGSGHKEEEVGRSSNSILEHHEQHVLHRDLAATL